MFVGHLAVALAAKRRAPTVSLGWLMTAVTVMDLAWPVFLIAGIEHVSIVPGATAFTPLAFDSYPWSHSLAMAFVWAGILLGIARWRGVLVPTGLLFALVISHWVLDFLSHAPDMPLWPGPSPKLGLGLWYSIPATLVVEGTMWCVAIAMYLRAPGRLTSGGKAAFCSFVVVCTAMWAPAPWAPVPLSENAVGWFAMIGWLTVPWATFADRRVS